MSEKLIKKICLGLLIQTSLVWLLYRMIYLGEKVALVFLIVCFFQLLLIAGVLFVGKFLQEKVRKRISTIVITVFYVFYFVLLLLICAASVDFYDWEMLLWGGYFYCLILSISLQCISVAGMLLTDYYLKNKIYRLISIVILAVVFIAIFLRSLFFFIMNTMDYEVRKLKYTDYPYQQLLPIEFQAIICVSVAILLGVLILRTIKAKKSTKNIYNK